MVTDLTVVVGAQSVVSFVATVPFEALAAWQGSPKETIVLEAASAKKGRASWTDRGIPQIAEYDSSVNVLAFPAMPDSFTPNPPALLTALGEAHTAADALSSRYALGYAQLRGKGGTITTTDGRQVLRQGGFSFPWTEDLLVPASRIFGSPQLPQGQPVAVGRTDDWVIFAVEPWFVLLRINKDGRFPKVEDYLRPAAEATSHFYLESGDAQFLAEALPRLPSDDKHNQPVTLDLNGRVFVRAKAPDTNRVTELLLTNSRMEGEPVVINRQKRQSRLVQSTLASPKQLQKVA